MRHTPEFAGREGLALSLTPLQSLRLRPARTLAGEEFRAGEHCHCGEDPGWLLTEQSPVQLFKAPRLALITQPVTAAALSLCSGPPERGCENPFCLWDPKQPASAQSYRVRAALKLSCEG